MRNLFKALLLVIQISAVSYAADSMPSLAPNFMYKHVSSSHLELESNVIASKTDTKLNESVCDKKPSPCIDNQSLTSGEALAAAFALLQLSPPIETATINIPTAMTLLLTSPNAYLSNMSPIQGEACWLQGSGISQLEPINASSGYVLMRWPARKLGIPKDAKLILRMNSPVITAQYLWSDFNCYGSDIARFLLQQVTNWQYSTRRLIINRSGYREILFPNNLKDAVRHRQVGPILEPYLKQAVPQLYKELKTGEIQ